VERIASCSLPGKSSIIVIVNVTFGFMADKLPILNIIMERYYLAIFKNCITHSVRALIILRARQ
jgi:carbon starvation protein CstA